MNTPVRTVTCPQCGDPSPWSPENPHRPFCSQRCKMIDLGCWADESYRVPVQEEAPSAEGGSADSLGS
ncbi:MAG: hypothetical protein RIR00_2 [Pseudomonadota bacterium]|jgi:endogenous inhibitor of DNA gyrase (YacG/DUF329 family)